MVSGRGEHHDATRGIVLLHLVAVVALLVSLGLGTQLVRADDNDGSGNVTVNGGKVGSTATTDTSTNATSDADLRESRDVQFTPARRIQIRAGYPLPSNQRAATMNVGHFPTS